MPWRILDPLPQNAAWLFTHTPRLSLVIITASACFTSAIFESVAWETRSSTSPKQVSPSSSEPNELLAQRTPKPLPAKVNISRNQKKNLLFDPKHRKQCESSLPRFVII